MSKTVVDYINEAIQLQNAVDRTKHKIQAIKQKIAPYVRQNTVKTPLGSASYVAGAKRKQLDKTRLFRVLMQKLGLSRDAASQIINMGMSEHIIKSYVRFNKAK